MVEGTMKQPFGLTLAQRVCRPLPPLLAHRVRERLYTLEQAKVDNFSFVVRSQTGSIFHGQTIERHAHYFSILGYCFWRNLAVALAVCKPGDHIIEIGANVGTETVGFSDIVGSKGRVSAFEPVPSNLETLKAALADINHPNVQIYPYALSDKNAQVRFAAPPSAHKSGIGYILNDGEAGDANVFTVESVRLDSLSLDPAAMIFIDVEGAEVAVLRGAREYLQTNHPYLMVEVIPRQLNRAGVTVEDLHNLISSLGYEAYRVGRTGLENPAHEVVANDWVCIPRERQEKAAEISRMLRLCTYLPCAFGLNPISHKRWGKEAEKSVAD